MGSEFLIILMLFLGAGPTAGNDFLDMIPTDAYWQAKHVTVAEPQLEQDAAADKAPENVDKLVKDLGADDFKTRDDARKALEAMGPSAAPLLKPALDSKDPEVAAVAGALVKQFSEHGRERSIRRLMAIRTLGEHKEKAALPLLKTLIDSRELFVSDYALRAVAQIEGNPLTRIDHRKELAADLQLLPKTTGIVLQATGLPGPAITLDKVVDQALDPANQNPMLGPMNAGKAPDKKKMLTRLTARILDVIERVGNLRIDGVTSGVAQDAGPNGGWAVIALRGKYNAVAMAAAIKSTSEDNVKMSREGKIDILDMGEEFTLLFPSNDQLIFIPASSGAVKAPIVESVLAVLNGGKGAFDDNKPLAALLKTVDATSPAWAAALLNADERKEQPFTGFDSIILSSKPVKDSLTFTVTGQGSDAETVKASADDLASNIQTGITQMKAMAAQMKSLQAMIDVLESIKVTLDGKTATMTGEIKPAVVQSAVSGAAPMLWMEFLESDDDAPDTQPQAFPPPNLHTP